MRQVDYKGPILSIDRLKIRYMVREGVYPPREDTFLLLETLEDRFGRRGQRYLDLGCGAGLCSVAGSKRGWEVWALDRNPRALTLTRSNLELNGLSARLLMSDLFLGVPGSMRGMFDVISFNPPYLRGGTDGLEPYDRIAILGGPTGMETALAFLVEGIHYLSENGSLIILSPGWGRDILDQRGEAMGLEMSVLNERPGSDEELCVLSASLKKTP